MPPTSPNASASEPTRPGDGTYQAALELAVRAAVEAGELLRHELRRPGGPRGSGATAAADEEAETQIRAALDAEYRHFGLVLEEHPEFCRPAIDKGQHVWLVDPNDGTSAFLRGYRGAAVSIALLRAGVPVLGVVFAYAAPDDDGDLIAWAEGCGPVRRNGAAITRPAWADALDARHTLLVSHQADRSVPSSEANARLCTPARFRAMPSIAYRLALVAAGDAEAAVALGGARDYDFAAGHALLLATGGALVDQSGAPVTYTADGRSQPGYVVGAGPTLAPELARRPWRDALAAPRARLPRRDVLGPAGRGTGVADPLRLARGQGCLLGQLAGDSLGSLVEFQDAARVAARYPEGPTELEDGGTFGTLAGQPTDDSEMALMLARELASTGEYRPDEVAAAYAFWYASGPFDIGHTTTTALQPAAEALRTGRSAASAAVQAARQGSRSSQANGALMRVSPLGIFGHEADPTQLVGWARTDASLTHPHRVCQDANAIFVLTIAHALHRPADADAASVYAYALAAAQEHELHDDVVATLKAAAEGPPADTMSQMGWVRIALGNAFYQLLHAESLAEGVIRTVRAGGDTDTNAAIAGALLGAVYGRDAIPRQWQDRVLTCRPIAGLPGVRQARPRAFWPIDALVLAERLLSGGPAPDIA